MKRIFLLDTMSQVYRAYHASAHQSIQMSTKAGFPTGATYIFARMFKKLVEEHKPEYMIACMEGGSGATNREKMYPEYKANRRGETPPELTRQFPYVNDLIDAYGLKRISVEGYEADDIIGTLSRQFYEADPENQIFIVSGDKDMFQLVNDRIFIVNPMKDLLADAQKVELIVGVPPTLVTDVMALRGDTVDNVPGAPGIGDKGSVAIIKQFGSLTAALDRAGEVTRKSYRESLQNNRAQIELSHKLVTIDRNAPVGIGWINGSVGLDQHVFNGPDAEALKKIYVELEFASLLGKESLAAVEDFAEIVQPDAPAVVDTRTTMTEETADKLIDSLF
jgi:DNA polymerase I